MAIVSPPTRVCDFRPKPVRRRPFTHVRADDFIAPGVYQALLASFPDCARSSGPTGFSLFWGDPGYDQLLSEQPAWRDLFDSFHSQAYCDYCIAQFAPYWRKYGCLTDLAQARYVPYREDRVDKELRYLRQVELAPHELWVRMDIQQAHVGYGKDVHVDHRRRLISQLIYFCDAQANGMEGGDLILHPEGKPTWFRRPVTVRPRHNHTVLFPCYARSLHSVSTIVAQGQLRNFIQVTLSSSVDAWA